MKTAFPVKNKITNKVINIDYSKFTEEYPSEKDFLGYQTHDLNFDLPNKIYYRNTAVTDVANKFLYRYFLQGTEICLTNPETQAEISFKVASPRPLFHYEMRVLNFSNPPKGLLKTKINGVPYLRHMENLHYKPDTATLRHIQAYSESKIQEIQKFNHSKYFSKMDEWERNLLNQQHLKVYGISTKNYIEWKAEQDFLAETFCEETLTEEQLQELHLKAPLYDIELPLAIVKHTAVKTPTGYAQPIQRLYCPDAWELSLSQSDTTTEKVPYSVQRDTAYKTMYLMKDLVQAYQALKFMEECNDDTFKSITYSVCPECGHRYNINVGCIEYDQYGNEIYHVEPALTQALGYDTNNDFYGNSSY